MNVWLVLTLLGIYLHSRLAFVVGAVLWIVSSNTGGSVLDRIDALVRRIEGIEREMSDMRFRRLTEESE